MSPRSLRMRVVALGLLVSATSACQLTVQITTSLEPDGGGTLRIAMVMDAELVAQLKKLGQGESEGLADIEALFERLRAKGWTIERKEPAGGLILGATRRFADAEAFNVTLSELNSSSSGGAFGDLGPTLGVKAARSFLRSSTSFSGSMDLSGTGLDPKVRSYLEPLSRVVQFEVRARMPGALGDVTGGGVAEGDEVVWRPKLGSSLSFAAQSSSLRVGALLAVLVPVLLVVGGSAWFMLGRRRPEDDQPMAIIPDEPSGAGAP